MQRRGASEALDGHDLVALVRQRKRQAGIDASAVDQHGACPALPAIATLLGALEPKVLAHRIEQRDPWIEPQLIVAAIHRQPDFGQRIAGRRNCSLGGLGPGAGRERRCKVRRRGSAGRERAGACQEASP